MDPESCQSVIDARSRGTASLEVADGELGSISE
jgi:hypothetical protein